MYLLLILSALGMWAGGCGESMERGESPRLLPDSGSVSEVLTGVWHCLESAMSAKLLAGCRFPSSCSDEYLGECEGIPLCHCVGGEMLLSVTAAPFPCENKVSLLHHLPGCVFCSCQADRSLLGDGKVWRAGRRRRFVPLSQDCFPASWSWDERMNPSNTTHGWEGL